MTEERKKLGTCDYSRHQGLHKRVNNTATTRGCAGWRASKNCGVCGRPLTTHYKGDGCVVSDGAAKFQDAIQGARREQPAQAEPLCQNCNKPKSDTAHWSVFGYHDHDFVAAGHPEGGAAHPDLASCGCGCYQCVRFNNHCGSKACKPAGVVEGISAEQFRIQNSSKWNFYAMNEDYRDMAAAFAEAYAALKVREAQQPIITISHGAPPAASPAPWAKGETVKTALPIEQAGEIAQLQRELGELREERDGLKHEIERLNTWEDRLPETSLEVKQAMELMRAEAALGTIASTLPETFYADRRVVYRVEMMVDGWQRAVKANQELESALPEMLELLEAYIAGDYTDAAIGLTEAFDVAVREVIRKARVREAAAILAL